MGKSTARPKNLKTVMMVKHSSRKNLRAAKKSRAAWSRVTGEQGDQRLKLHFDHMLTNDKPLKDSFFLTFDVMTSHKYKVVMMYKYGPRWAMQLQRAMAAKVFVFYPLLRK